ncbi:MAG TPA: hypothetical protein VKO18_10650 [Terriglobia bacterium]|nr:hypothetical protein [Terriglobia bacterium]
MQGKKQVKESRQKGEAGHGAEMEFHGSLRSQASIKKEWQLKSLLKTCKAQIGLWERKLEPARQGITRNTLQISSGQGMAHSTLQRYVAEVEEAKRMIASFQEQAVALQKQIEALQPDAVKASERAEGQKALAIQVLARLEMDRKLDAALEAVWGILYSRAALTSNIHEGAMALEFHSALNLDDRRFDALLHALPQDMAHESEKWVTWFLGREDERRPCAIHGGEAVLPETLFSHNAFQSGDCPNLTEAEDAEITRIIASRNPIAPPPEMARKQEGPPEEVPLGKIHWAMMR